MYRLMHLFQVIPPEVRKRCLTEILQCIVLPDNGLTSSTEGVQPVNKTLLECSDMCIHGVSFNTTWPTIKRNRQGKKFKVGWELGES